MNARELQRAGGTAAKCHDLLELFDRLPEGTRRRLEQKMPTVPDVHPELPPVYPGIREALEANRTLFVEWRYVYERLGAYPETAVLKEALAAMIDTFEEPILPPELTLPHARDG